ncbi:MAG: O-antigen ligase family protein [Planctomycetaceae bacterium]
MRTQPRPFAVDGLGNIRVRELAVPRRGGPLLTGFENRDIPLRVCSFLFDFWLKITMSLAHSAGSCLSQAESCQSRSSSSSWTSRLRAALISPALPGWLAVAVGFNIPLSTSVMEVLTGFFVLAALAWRRPTPATVWSGAKSTLLISTGLFLAMLVGLSWTSAPLKDGIRCLLKYRELLLLPLFTQVFAEARWRRLAVRGFLAGCGILLTLSYLEWITGFDLGITQVRFPNDHVIFKDRIIHNLLMSLFAYLAALEWERSTGAIRWGWLAAIGLAVFNMTFLVQGRTGYLAFGALLTLWSMRRFGWRGLLLTAVVLVSGAVVACKVSAVVHSRFLLTWNQIQNQFGSHQQHSDDPRMEFYVNTLQLIARHPWVGTGTGSFETEYTAYIEGRDLLSVSEPHNEFLHLTFQLGLLGGLAWLALLVNHWRLSRSLPAWERAVLQGVVLCIGLGTLFNSLILSVTGGVVWSFLAGVAAGASLEEGSAEPARIE